MLSVEFGALSSLDGCNISDFTPPTLRCFYCRTHGLLIVVALASPVRAGQLELYPDQPAITALRLNAGETINLDGSLDEPVWSRAEPASDFTQSDPQYGAPATESTEIRILFDQDSLYIGAELFDSDPDGMLANQMVRDGFLNADDRFMWTIDPFYDQRSGYFFEINPAGAMGDAQLVPAKGSNEVGTIQNRAWDGIWLARVSRHERGWTAEIEIPFRILSFDSQGVAWGLNFQRTVRRRNEESFWSGWERNQGLFNLAFSGRIEGISDVSQGRGLDVQPYVIGTYDKTTAGPGNSTYGGDGGVDIIYSLTPQLKANLTINTDFAQTEVDDRQVNLTRYPLFFPEKRDFFLEGAGNFDFGRERFNIMTAFFSRRIGLTANGTPQKIDYGTKVTGQVGGIDLGLMQVRTAAEPGIAGEDFMVIRPRRSFFLQSNAGMIYTRRATRDVNIPDRHTIGVDFQLATTQFRGSENLQFSGFYVRTPDGVRHGDDAAWVMRFDYPNDLWTVQSTFKSFQENFDPAMGFVERTGLRLFVNTLQFAPRPNTRLIRRVATQARFRFAKDMEGNWLERTYMVNLLNLDFQSGDRATIQVVPSYERLDRDFRVTRGVVLPAGNEYQFTRYSFGFSTANRRMISGNVNVTLGTFYSGDRRDLRVGLNLRPRPGFLATLSSSFNRIELPEGSFSTKVLRAIVNTQFGPLVSIANNVQYDSVSRVLGWQSRFRWIVTPGNDIYFVWVNNWLDMGDRLTTVSRNAATKIIYTHSF